VPLPNMTALKLNSSRRRINMAVSPVEVSAYKREQGGMDVIGWAFQPRTLQ
jgi:hypothetical protein